jgi:CheY-like chemotaxis protein
LVVDDEPLMLATMAEVLAEAGFDVLTACSGPQALDRCDEEPVDVVVSDVMMPVMNGCEVAATLTSRQPGVRVLLVTGGCGRMLVDNVLPVLYKPFSADALIGAVSDLLRGEPRSLNPLGRASFP